MKRRRKNSLADLFRRHGGMSWKSAQLAKDYEKRHTPKAAPAKKHRGTSRASGDQDQKDIISALRELGYQRVVAESAARQAKGADFDSKMRSALAAASFGSIRRKNSMAKKRKKRKKNSRRRSVRRVKINRRRRNSSRRRRRVVRHRLVHHRARRRNSRRRSQRSTIRSIVREMMGGRKRRKKNSRQRKAHRNPARSRIIKVGSPALAKKLARKLQGMGYRARYVKR